MKCNNCCLLIWKQNVQILTSVNLSWVRQIFLMLELISMFKITSSLFLQCKVDHWNSTRPLLFVLDHRNVTKVKRQMLKKRFQTRCQNDKMDTSSWLHCWRSVCFLELKFEVRIPAVRNILSWDSNDAHYKTFDFTLFSDVSIWYEYYVVHKTIFL